MKTWKLWTFGLCIFVAFFGLFFVSCEGVIQGGNTIINGETVPVSGVTLNKTSLTMTAGDIENLTATVVPTNATNRTVTWSCSNTFVATVDTNGNVETKNAGTATITVATVDGGFTATFTVTVNAGSDPVTGITLNKTSLVLTAGETETLEATVLPHAAANKNVSLISSNPSVAFMNNGIVTAISPGTAVIVVTTQDGAYTAQCVVTVYLAVNATNRYQATPTSDTGTDKIKYSYTYGKYDFYYIHLGELSYVPSYKDKIHQQPGLNIR